MYASYKTTDIIKTIKTNSAKYNVTPITFARANRSEKVYMFVAQIKPYELTSVVAYQTVAQITFDNVEAATNWISQGEFEDNVSWWAS